MSCGSVGVALRSYKLDQQFVSDFTWMGIWTPFSRSPSTIQVMAMAGTLNIVFPSGNDNSKFSRISTTMECNSITLSNGMSAFKTLDRHETEMQDSREFPTDAGTGAGSCGA